MTGWTTLSGGLSYAECRYSRTLVGHIICVDGRWIAALDGEILAKGLTAQQARDLIDKAASDRKFCGGGLRKVEDLGV